MSKVVAPRDTKLRSGRELTNSNLLTEICRKKSGDCSFSNPTGTEHAWIANLGRRFLTCGTFTLDDPEKSIMGKTVDLPVLSPEPEDSPRTVSTSERTLGKRGQKY